MKAVLIERLSKVLSKNVPTIDVFKILVLLPTLRTPSASSNNTQRAASRLAVPIDVTQILLELNEKDTTTATSNFNTCNPADSLGIDANQI